MQGSQAYNLQGEREERRRESEPEPTERQRSGQGRGQGASPCREGERRPHSIPGLAVQRAQKGPGTEHLSHAPQDSHRMLRQRLADGPVAPQPLTIKPDFLKVYFFCLLCSLL